MPPICMRRCPCPATHSRLRRRASGGSTKPQFPGCCPRWRGWFGDWPGWELSRAERLSAAFHEQLLQLREVGRIGAPALGGSPVDRLACLPDTGGGDRRIGPGTGAEEIDLRQAKKPRESVQYRCGFRSHAFIAERENRDGKPLLPVTHQPFISFRKRGYSLQAVGVVIVFVCEE